jgi:hypothetical protein
MHPKYRINIEISINYTFIECNPEKEQVLENNEILKNYVSTRESINYVSTREIMRSQ